MSRRLKVLVTGFGPFPGMPANPSGRLALNLARLRRPALADMAVETFILPTTWAAMEQMPDLLARLKPDVVLMLGVAGRRKAVCVEMQAVNAAADAPDAHRRHPARGPLVDGAPCLRRANVDGMRLRAALRGVPAALSRNAGRYLCNAVYFRVLQALSERADPPPAVFVHIPARPKTGGAAFERRLTTAAGSLLVALAAERRRPGAGHRPSGAGGVVRP